MFQVIGKNLCDRLCIATPPCHSASPPTNPDPEIQLLPGTSTAPPIEHVPEAYMQEYIDNAFALMTTDGLSESFGWDTILDVSQLTLMPNLPYFQLKYPILQGRKWRSSPVC